MMYGDKDMKTEIAAKRVDEYDVMRFILVVLVVYGHSYYNVLFYGVGGIDYSAVFIRKPI